MPTSHPLHERRPPESTSDHRPATVFPQGYLAGQADREDGWSGGYRDSYAYEDANWGYNSLYVNQPEYNYYFRQGFERGYSDGYNSRNQYGRSVNGKYEILANLLSQILNLRSLR